MASPKVDVQWHGRDDIVRIRAGDHFVEVPYYEVMKALEQVPKQLDWPLPCPTCQGSGEVAFPEEEPRDLITCPTCEGHRIDRRYKCRWCEKRYEGALRDGRCEACRAMRDYVLCGGPRPV